MTLTKLDKLTDEELFHVLLIEQLRRKGLTIDRVKEKYGNSNDWLDNIRWETEDEAKDFEQWACATIMKRGQIKRNKNMAERLFTMWNLDVGLGIGPIGE